MEWILTVGILLLAAALWALFWFTRPHLRCPMCQSQRVGTVASEPVALRDASMHMGTASGGGYPTVQQQIETTYQCDQCRHRWSQMTTRTR